MKRSRGPQSRRSDRTALAASLLFHALALSGLVLGGARLSAPSAVLRPIELDLRRLDPPADRPTRAARTITAPSPLAAASARGSGSPAAAAAEPVVDPAAPAMPAATARGIAAPVGGGGNPAAGGGVDAGTAGALRGLLGCANVGALRLSAAERERCTTRMAAGVREAAPVDIIPAEKRAWFDAAVFAQSKMKGPAPVAVADLGDQFGLRERWAAPPGAHMPGVGCKMPLGKPRGWKSYRAKPPHSLKLGPLPCFITPPSGFATEADVDAPASLRERTDDAAHMRRLEATKASSERAAAPVAPG